MSSGDAWAAAARDALGQVEAVLAGRPERDTAALKTAVQALARARDGVVALHRRDGGPRWRPVLEHLNAVVSVVMAAAFPIGEVPWAELEKARDWLAALVDGPGSRKPPSPGAARTS